MKTFSYLLAALALTASSVFAQSTLRSIGGFTTPESKATTDERKRIVDQARAEAQRAAQQQRLPPLIVQDTPPPPPPAIPQNATNKVQLHYLTSSRVNYPQSARWQAIVEMAYLNPVRQWGNDIYDFRPAFGTFNSGSEEVDGFVLRSGKVVSITDEGMLVMLDEKYWPGFKTVFMRRAPFAGTVVDGSIIAAFGRPMPPYSYTSALGAKRTVECFDCGEAPERKYVEQLDALTKAGNERRAAEVREAAAKQAAAIKAAADKRMADAKARAAKAFADRVAKEKQEGK